MFVILLVFCLMGIDSEAAAATTTPSCGDVTLNYEFSSETGHCYRINPQVQKWDVARSICQHEGADLAVINSEAEAQVFMNLFRRYPVGSVSCHGEEYCSLSVVGLGVVYSNESRQFLTIQGESLRKAGYSSWWSKSRESNGYMTRSGKLTDFNGSLFYTGFICEKESGR